MGYPYYLVANLRSQSVQVRPARQDDTRSLFELRSLLFSETSLLLPVSGQTCRTLATERNLIKELLSSPNSTLLVAESEGQLVGYAAAFGMQEPERSHSSSLALGVAKQFWAQGIGTALLTSLDEWARLSGVRRLEIWVMAHNHRALTLYTRQGFTPEGTRRHSLQRNSEFLDECLLGKLIG